MPDLCTEKVLAQRGLPADLDGRLLELTYREGRATKVVVATVDRVTMLGDNILIIRLKMNANNPFKFISYASDGRAGPQNPGWFGVKTDDSSVDLADLRLIAAT